MLEAVIFLVKRVALAWQPFIGAKSLFGLSENLLQGIQENINVTFL